MANILEILINAKDQASKELEGVTKTLQGMSNELKVAGAAMTVVGAAGLKMSADARKLNADLAQTGITLGVSTKEMRGMALAVTDVTFPLKSVTATFTLLSKAGITNTETMKASSKAFDALADATGSSAEVMADLLLPAFKLFGREIPTTSAELDKFTWLTKNTLVEMEDFGTLLTRMAPYMDELNLSMEDAIAILAALSEHGITGTAATLALRTAITQAASGATDLNTALGLTQEEIDSYKDKMSDATGITDQYAAAANTQYGLLDKIKQKFSEITLVVGSLLGPLEPLLAVLTALGPVLIFISTATGIATIKWIAHTGAIVAHGIALVATKAAMIAATVAQWALNVAMSANPIGLIILAIAGLVLGIIALVKHFDKVKAAFQAVGNFIVGVFQGIAGFFERLVAGIKATFWKVIDAVLTPIRIVVNGVIEGINWIIRLINKLPGVNLGEIGWKFPEFAKPMQQGGIVTKPTVALIGEHGPEAVIPLSRGGAATTINITVQGSVIAERDLTDLIYEQLLAKKGRNALLGLT